jgi:hypothetical protein
MAFMFGSEVRTLRHSTTKSGRLEQDTEMIIHNGLECPVEGNSFLKSSTHQCHYCGTKQHNNRCKSCGANHEEKTHQQKESLP